MMRNDNIRITRTTGSAQDFFRANLYGEGSEDRYVKVINKFNSDLSMGDERVSRYRKRFGSLVGDSARKRVTKLRRAKSESRVIRTININELHLAGKRVQDIVMSHIPVRDYYKGKDSPYDYYQPRLSQSFTRDTSPLYTNLDSGWVSSEYDKDKDVWYHSSSEEHTIPIHEDEELVLIDLFSALESRIENNEDPITGIKID